MGYQRLHSFLGASDYRVNEIAPMRSPFVSRQFAPGSGRALESIDVGRVNSFVEMLRSSPDFELFDIAVVGVDPAETRMR